MIIAVDLAIRFFPSGKCDNRVGTQVIASQKYFFSDFLWKKQIKGPLGTYK